VTTLITAAKETKVLVAPDKRFCRNLTFDNVLAQQGSSFCNRAHLQMVFVPYEGLC